MQYIQTKTVYIDRDELIEIKAIEHDVKTRFIDFKFIAANKILDISNCIVRVYALNSKGNEIFNNLTVTDGAKGIARLELTDALLVPGTIEYMLKITTDNGGILSSNRFNLIVDKDLMTGNAIEGTNEYKALDEALKTVGELNSMQVSINENANNIKKNKDDLNKKIDDNVSDLTSKIIKNKENLITLSKSQENTTNLYNIISNGSFYGDGRCWECTGTEFWSGTYDGFGLNNRACASFTNSSYVSGDNAEKYLQTYKSYKVEKNTDYTLSLHYAVERNVESMDIFIILGNTENRDYGKPILAKTANGGEQTNIQADEPFTFKFNTGNFNWVWIRIDHNGMKQGSDISSYKWIYISEVALYKGDTGRVKWLPKIGETYSKNINMDTSGMVFGDGEGTYSHTNDKGELEYVTEGIYNKYVALTYEGGITIPAGNPGIVNVKLPKEFTKRKNSLKWSVVPSGYYYNTSGNFFPYNVSVGKNGEAFEQDGFMVLPIQGVCKIQNGNNSSDSQNISVNATIFAFA